MDKEVLINTQYSLHDAKNGRSEEANDKKKNTFYMHKIYLKNI